MGILQDTMQVMLKNFKLQQCKCENYNGTIENDFKLKTKKMIKIKLFLHISRCYFQMQTLTSLYTIGGCKLSNLQNYVKNVHYNFTHTLIPIQARTSIMIHIIHPMHLVIGSNTHLCIIFHMLEGIKIMMLQLETNHNCHKLVYINATKFTLKQQFTISIGISRNPKPNKEKKGKMWV